MPFCMPTYSIRRVLAPSFRSTSAHHVTLPRRHIPRLFPSLRLLPESSTMHRPSPSPSPHSRLLVLSWKAHIFARCVVPCLAASPCPPPLRATRSPFDYPPYVPRWRASSPTPNLSPGRKATPMPKVSLFDAFLFLPHRTASTYAILCSYSAARPDSDAYAIHINHT